MDNYFDTSETKDKFEKTNFFKQELGQHIVRFVGSPYKYFSHYVKSYGFTTSCLFDDCPICKNNKRLLAENPNAWKDNPNYSGRAERFLHNILDRTMVKVCPSCQSENKKDVTGNYSHKCWSCDTLITSVEEHPSGKIKVINLTKTNAEDLNNFNRTILDENKNPIGIPNMDFMVMITKTSGGKKNTTVIPMPQSRDVIEVPTEMYYNLENAIIKLTPDEIISALKGVSLKDIFIARRSSSEETKVAELSDELKAQVSSAMNNLFTEA